MKNIARQARKAGAFPALFLLLMFILSGCATSHVATKIGENIADSYATSAKLGLASADKIHDNWPYVSGLIKGVSASDYTRKVPFYIQETIAELDALCAKESISNEEKGALIGLTVRLEYLGGKFYWDEYGVSLYKWFKVFLTGA